MPANFIQNDPTQTIPASNATVDAVNSFKQIIFGVAENISNSTASKGLFKDASVSAAEAIRAEAQRFTAATEPRFEAIRAAAEDATRVSEDGAGSVGSIDTTF